MTHLTLQVGSTRPIKYSHRGTVVVADITVEVVAQIDGVYQRLLDIRWMSASILPTQAAQVDAALMTLVGQEISDLGNKTFPGEIHLLPWDQWNSSTR